MHLRVSQVPPIPVHDALTDLRFPGLWHTLARSVLAAVARQHKHLFTAAATNSSWLGCYLVAIRLLSAGVADASSSLLCT